VAAGFSLATGNTMAAALQLMGAALMAAAGVLAGR
jgi:hypothetical protein